MCLHCDAHSVYHLDSNVVSYLSAVFYMPSSERNQHDHACVYMHVWEKEIFITCIFFVFPLASWILSYPHKKKKKCLHLKAFGYLVDHKRGMKDSVYVYMQPNNVSIGLKTFMSTPQSIWSIWVWSKWNLHRIGRGDVDLKESDQ